MVICYIFHHRSKNIYHQHIFWWKKKFSVEKKNGGKIWWEYFSGKMLVEIFWLENFYDYFVSKYFSTKILPPKFFHQIFFPPKIFFSTKNSTKFWCSTKIYRKKTSKCSTEKPAPLNQRIIYSVKKVFVRRL